VLDLAPRLVEMLTARLNPVPAGGLRLVQPPRLLHTYRVRQPSFRTMNRYEMPRSGHPQGVPLRDIAARRLARRHVTPALDLLTQDKGDRRRPVGADMAAQILAEPIDV
jgi:hypothetical protein